MSEPHARAALMHGGIVWHLVRESINNNAVLVGPTDEVFIHGDVVCFDTNLECWDSPTHSHLSIGQGNQVSELSWWPKPSAWRTSGLNVGYWSAACENWFQRRIKDIHNGTAELRSATQWKSVMNLNKKQSKLAATNEGFAARWLDQVHFA